jgi:hypothetical protein
MDSYSCYARKIAKICQIFAYKIDDVLVWILGITGANEKISQQPSLCWKIGKMSLQ